MPGRDDAHVDPGREHRPAAAFRRTGQRQVGRRDGAHGLCGTNLARTGPVVSGQRLAVAYRIAGAGYTGPFTHIYAWFVPANPSSRPAEIAFTDYGAKPIPTGITVPCGGTGQVEFSSCPYLAPCAYGWKPAYVEVRFVNIAT